MAASFEAMKLDPAYRFEAEELDMSLEAYLPEETDEWWKS